jgi:hypothetical protein
MFITSEFTKSSLRVECVIRYCLRSSCESQERCSSSVCEPVERPWSFESLGSLVGHPMSDIQGVCACVLLEWRLRRRKGSRMIMHPLIRQQNRRRNKQCFSDELLDTKTLLKHQATGSHWLAWSHLLRFMVVPSVYPPSTRTLSRLVS